MILKKSEYEPIKLYIYLLITIILIWILFLGWRPGLFFIGNDGIGGMQPFLMELFRNGGSWKNTVYMFKADGGTMGSDSAGIVPFYELACYLGISTFSAQIILNFLLQTGIAFFSVCTIRGLATLLSEKSPDCLNQISVTLIIGIIFAFLPFIGWRIYYGHELILLGLLSFIVPFTIIIAHAAGHLSLSLLIISIIYLTHSFPSRGQQIIAYSIIFGLPIFAGLFLELYKDKKKLLGFTIAILISVLALTLILPRFASMLISALGSDSGRTINSFPLTYSYVTGSISDWLTSIPVLLSTLTPTRPQYFWHEVNYGFGPLIIMLFLFPWKKWWKFGVGLLITLISCFLFTNDVQPFSTLITSTFKILQNFRVPHRSILILAWPFSILAITSLIVRLKLKREFKNQFTLWAIFLLFSIVVWTKFEMSEFVIFGLFIASALMILFRPSTLLSYRETLIFLLTSIAALNILAFSQRAIQMYPTNEITNTVDNIRNIIFSQRPDLQKPFQRAKLSFGLGWFNANTPVVLGLNSIEGYIEPTKRFGQLVAALYHRPYDVTNSNILFDINSPQFAVLQQIYNVSTIITAPNNTIAFSNVVTPGPVWFPKTFESASSINKLASAVSSNIAHIATKAFILSDDFPDIKKLTPCSDAQAELISYINSGVSIKYHSDNECLMTVSTNYSSKLIATHNEQRLQIVPVYGVLTGVIIPASSGEIFLSQQSLVPVWIYVVSILGFILTAIILIYYRKSIMINKPVINNRN